MHSLGEEDEKFLPDEARECNMLAIAHVRLVQRIVREALWNKSEAGKADLATALDYYTDKDAFIDLSRGRQ